MKNNLNENIVDKFGYIYKITNKINKKIYVGKRIGTEFDENYWGSGIKLRKALSEFGKENFDREIIEWCSSNDILKEREKYWIVTLNARDPQYGYNKIPGGEGKINPDCMFRKGASIISLQLPKEIYNKLKKKSYEECTSTSYLIRRAIIKEIREWESQK
jgi:hypothetical protein